MTNFKVVKLAAVFMAAASVCFAAAKKDAEQKAAPAAPAATLPSGMLFATNMPKGQAQAAPFSAEVSADFIKKVMETSAKIEGCKKQIAERQAYLYQSNPKIKECRQEMVAIQEKINQLLTADKELAELRLNRDILWTTMPVLPKGRAQHMPPQGGPVAK